MSVGLDFYQTCCSLARLCAIIFCWSLTTELALLCVWVVAPDVNLDFSNNSPLTRFAQYTLVIVVVAGAGMLVLGGVAWGMDVAGTLVGDRP